MKSHLRLWLRAVLFAEFFPEARGDYSQLALDDKWVAYWRFNELTGSGIFNSGTAGIAADGVV